MSQVPAEVLPVARVAVDVALPHLDRLFDYLVPQSMTDLAGPGCRVKVRFSGRLTSGYLVQRVEASEHSGSIAFLHKVVSAEPVLTGEIAGLARAVADRYGGTMADVLRLAIPPRYAAAEISARAAREDIASRVPPDASLWARYPAGKPFLAALESGRSPHAVWSALPGQDWPAEIAHAAAAAYAGGRGALVVVPDARDLAAVESAMAQVGGHAVFVSLAAQLGPAERYRRWLAVRRGEVKIVLGTRSAMFAPVADLGLVVIWDDGDDLHAEPRAPYPHARDVLLIRAHRSAAAALIGGFARTTEAEQLLASGWAKPLVADRQTVRRHAPLIRTAGEDAELARDEAARTARMPSLALRTARDALVAGPVLFQVPRRGYVAATACRRCGERVRCAACAGPVAITGRNQPLTCGWCGLTAKQSCATCGNVGLRALVTGARRTAEELARAFPGAQVATSSGASVLGQAPPGSALVIATPGAEPPADGGYAAAILLDGWALLGRPSLRAGEEALRRWMNAAALVRPGPGGGKVVLMADPVVPAVQALIRWDAASFARRELAERTELRFPPTVRIASLTGPPDAVEKLLSASILPRGSDVLGPVEVPRDGKEPAPQVVRFLVRTPWSAGAELAAALRTAVADRTARKDAGPVRLQLDPAELI
ncbi:MAG TPA: primosomal protein N' [Streptosporangiaceae bacterium]|nr:primosomal protein N' [Streptosporangiaceae bacterium]